MSDDAVPRLYRQKPRPIIVSQEIVQAMQLTRTSYRKVMDWVAEETGLEPYVQYDIYRGVSVGVIWEGCSDPCWEENEYSVWEYDWLIRHPALERPWPFFVRDQWSFPEYFWPVSDDEERVYHCDS